MVRYLEDARVDQQEARRFRAGWLRLAAGAVTAAGKTLFYGSIEP